MTLLPVSSFAQQEFTVNSEADTADASGGDGACDTGDTIVGGAAECTLRAAIQEANSTPETDTINFDIPLNELHTILPGSALPMVTESVIFDGTTQPGYDSFPFIEIDGFDAGGGEVFGLEIRAGNSTIKGLAINDFADTGLVLKTGDQNIVQANHIGTNASGNQVKRNFHDGIAIIGNYIGTDVTGTKELGNGLAGVLISAAVGTTEFAHDNITQKVGLV